MMNSNHDMQGPPLSSYHHATHHPMSQMSQQMNQMSQLTGQMGQMSQMGQMNQMNQMNQINQMNQMSQMQNQMQNHAMLNGQPPMMPQVRFTRGVRIKARMFERLMN